MFFLSLLWQRNLMHRRGFLLFLSFSLGIVLPIACSAADWPQLLGPNRNGTYHGPKIASEWPPEGPAIVWQKNIGAGFSGPVVADQRVILFHREKDQEIVDCLATSSGHRHWTFAYEATYRDQFGFDPGPRATPTIADDRVYTLGADGIIHCLDLKTGKQIWKNNIKSQFNTAQTFFGMACSPLIENGSVLLNIGGQPEAGIVALNTLDGKLRWQATSDEASCASPVSVTVDGRRLSFFLTREGLVILQAGKQNTSELYRQRWRSRTNASVNAATPLVIGNLLFLSSSYQTGAILFRLQEGQVSTVWSGTEILSNHYATSVHHQGMLYGFHGRQEQGPELRCIELESGKVKWSAKQFPSGTLIQADDRILALTEDGRLWMIQASPKSCKVLARAQILPRVVRAHPALASGFLYARSSTKLVCVDLRSHILSHRQLQP